MPSDKRLGIYGGSFAPVHLGHIRAAKAFLEACALDVLYVIPAGIPPHKQPAKGDTPEDRLAMLKIAFSAPEIADERIHISDYELTRPGKSYTILTLEHFRAESSRIFLLCGTDMFLTLPRWFRGEEILSSTAVVCFAREAGEGAAIGEAAARYRRDYHAEIYLPPLEPFPMSSTEVRRAVAEGKPTDGMLPPDVRAYIDAHGLYR